MTSVQNTFLGLLQDAETDLEELQADIARDLWEDEPAREMEDVESAARALIAAIKAYRAEADERAQISYFERHGGNDEHRMSAREFL